MGGRGRKALAVAGLALAVLLVILLLRAGERDRSAPSSGPREPSAEAVRSISDTGPPSSPEEPQGTAAGSSAAPGEPKPPPSVRIRGRVVGPAPGRGGPTRIEIVPVGWRVGHGIEPIETEAEEDGSFSLDVSSLFADDSRPAELEVRAGHPDFVPASKRVAIDEAVARKEEGASFEVEIVLVPAGIVTGEVRDEAGWPMTGAAVSIHPTENGKPQVSSIDSATTGPDGRYRLRGRANAPHFVVAVKEGLVPAAANVFAASGGETLAPLLVLAPGASISGRVTMGGKPVEGAKVVVWAEWRTGMIFVGRRQLTWNDEGVALWKVEGATDSNGHYRIAGVTPGPHRVRIDRVPGENVSAALKRALERKIQAPADDADIEIAGVHLTVTVRTEAGPVPRISVFLIQGGTFHLMMTDEDGRLTLLAQPDEPVEIRVEEKGYEEFSREVRMPSPGAQAVEVVDLDERQPRPTLVVVLDASDGPPVEHAGFGFFPPDATREFPQIRCNVEATNGRFRIENLEPGTWRVVVRAGGDWFGGRGYWVEAETRVDLPSSGEVEARIPLRRGGRLRIVAKGDDGAYLPAECVIRTPNGQRLDVHFVARVSGMSSEGGSPLDRHGPNEVATALPPGDYVVDLWLDEYAQETRDVVIEVGKTAELEVTLHPR